MATPTLGRAELIQANLIVSKGSDCRYNFLYVAGAQLLPDGQIDPAHPGTPVDMTGWTGASQIRDRIAGTVYADLVVTLGGDEGTIELLLAKEVSEAWPDRFTQGVWDLELTEDDGDTFRFAKGKVKVDPNVTREV